MKTIKRWFTLMLIVSVALSECGGTTVFAAENAAAVEMPDSEYEESSQESESAILDETSLEQELAAEEAENREISNIRQDPEEDKIVFPEDDENEDAERNEIGEEADAAQNDVIVSGTETELSALHIGQVKEGKNFPTRKIRDLYTICRFLLPVRIL